MSYTYNTLDIKSYADAPKLRIVAEEHFRADHRRDAIFQLFAQRGGRLSLEKIGAYVSVRGAAAGKSAIEQAINHVFALPNPTEGRFNTSAFAAFYVAKEIDTCIEEKRRQLKSRASSSPGYVDYRYVIFSTLFSGRLIDLRNAIAMGRWVMPVLHTQCKLVGEMIYKAKLDGIAAPSAQKINGNCCAIFTRTTLKAGEVVQAGVLKP